MAKLKICIPTTGSEFETTDIDFTQFTPQQIIDSMRGHVPAAGEGRGWKLLRGNQVVDQHVSLDQLGFRDGETAEVMDKVEGA